MGGSVSNVLGQAATGIATGGLSVLPDVLTGGSATQAINPGGLTQGLSGMSNKTPVLPEYQFNEAAFANPSSQFIQDSALNRMRDVWAENPFLMGQTTIDPRQQAQARQMQLNLAQAYQDQMAGRGPSLAQMQLQDATDANIAQAQALAASQRGMAPGMAQRLVAQQTQAAQQQASRDAARLRLQEALAAQQGLAGVSRNMRSQDQAIAEAQARMDFARNQQNQAAQYRTREAKEKAFGDYLDRFSTQTERDRQSQKELEELRARQRSEYNAAQFAAGEGALNRGANVLGGLMQGGATVLAG